MRTSKRRRDGTASLISDSLISTPKQAATGKQYNAKIIKMVNIRICDFNNFKNFPIMLFQHLRFLNIHFSFGDFFYFFLKKR